MMKVKRKSKLNTIQYLSDDDGYIFRPIKILCRRFLKNLLCQFWYKAVVKTMLKIVECGCYLQASDSSLAKELHGLNDEQIQNRRNKRDDFV